MGIGRAATLVIGDLVVQSIDWDPEQMTGMTPQVWKIARDRYNLGHGGGGFTLANSDIQSRDEAHRHKMWMNVEFDTGLRVRVYRDSSLLLAEQLREAVTKAFDSEAELIEHLKMVRGAGRKYLSSGYSPPGTTSNTQEIDIPGAGYMVKIDRAGMLHHGDGKYAGRINSITQLWARSDGTVW